MLDVLQEPIEACPLIEIVLADRPLTAQEKGDDAALRHAVRLVFAIHAFCPLACIMIENPV